MKIEKLTDNKIRIILNTDELTAQNIDVKSLVNNTDVAQNLFKTILKRAEKEVGFVVADSKLLIEAFVSSEGFFVITFTKFKPDIKTSNNKTAKLKVKRKSLYSSSKNVVFMFNNFDEFCNFCTYCNNCYLYDLSKIAKKVILYEYNSKFYLTISNINNDDNNTISNNYIITEHGKVIIKHNAIKNGIKYFV